ncbi:hypothetical protein FGL01_31890 [Flavobacterium glycines]|uniref:SCP domain-containing protein n=2 Tax=Flavobacterium glycines TaxID=551990 RepID=A0A1B9DWF2_9FLAO|nr:hypothetical protein FBGL_03290 [Flavobacterium glycines]GEL12450.1 hypothetical protein FGL01_31890 [Flavobacterium glycines]
MKLNLFLKITPIMVLFALNSCSADSNDVGDYTSKVKSGLVENYTYSTLETETLNAINEYRVSIGLNRLEVINHISFKSEEHDIYMINKKGLNHDDFTSRSENIMKVLGAITVAENIALNYNTPNSVLNAWLNSPKHKAVVVGNFTHFGISIREDTETGKKYFTNIFAKI